MAPTAQEVIDAGQYLEPDFPAESLTVAVLRAVLQYHGVAAQNSSTKPKLVQLFNDEIKPQAARLKRERERMKRQKPSSEGITDGVTGERLQSVETTSTRRSSRRTSQTPDPHLAVPEPRTRRQRASATPVPVLPPPKVEEVSEPEEPQPVKPSKKKSTATTSRRSTKSSPIAEDNEEIDVGNDSAWESNNPFQSGNSSPDRSPQPRSSKPASRKPRSTKKRPSRSSSPIEGPVSQVGIRSRQGLLYQFEPPPGTRLPQFESYNPPPDKIKTAKDYEEVAEPLEESDEERSPYNPSLSDQIEYVPLNDTPGYRRHSSPGAYPGDDEFDESEEEEEEEEEVVIKGESEEPEDHDARVSKRLSQITPRRSLRRRSSLPPPQSSGPNFIKWFFMILLAGFSFVLITYKQDSAYIGYCDADSDTNLRIHELQVERQLRQNNALTCRANFNLTKIGSNDLCSPVSLPTPFEANTCTPCPKRAICTPDSVTCKSNYVLRPHPLSLVPCSSWLNGIWASVAFPPKCVEDLDKIKKIGGLAVGIERWLAKTRGERLCAGVQIPYGDGGEAKALGLELEAVREAVRQTAHKQANNESVDDIFEKVLAQIPLVEGEDNEGVVYVATHRADFPTLKCRIRVTLRVTWQSIK
ncbi:inner nuclear membrane protein enriched at telomere/subtelomere region, partial [Tulasnella sp. 403]